MFRNLWGCCRRSLEKNWSGRNPAWANHSRTHPADTEAEVRIPAAITIISLQHPPLHFPISQFNLKFPPPHVAHSFHTKPRIYIYLLPAIAAFAFNPRNQLSRSNQPESPRESQKEELCCLWEDWSVKMSKTYSPTEVASHKDAESGMWIIIDGEVFDVTGLSLSLSPLTSPIPLLSSPLHSSSSFLQIPKWY